MSYPRGIEVTSSFGPHELSMIHRQPAPVKQLHRFPWIIAFVVVALGLSPAVMADTVTIGGLSAIVRASSQLAGPKNDPNRYALKNLFDGDSSTCWAEGSPGEGIGEWVEIVLTGETPVCGLVLKPGLYRNPSLFSANCAIRSFELVTEGDSRRIDTIVIHFQCSFEVSEQTGDFIFSAKNTQWNLKPVLVPLGQRRIRTIRLRVLDVYRGKYKDLCISEISLVRQEKSLLAAVAGVLSPEVATRDQRSRFQVNGKYLLFPMDSIAKASMKHADSLGLVGRIVHPTMLMVTDSDTIRYKRELGIFTSLSTDFSGAKMAGVARSFMIASAGNTITVWKHFFFKESAEGGWSLWPSWTFGFDRDPNGGPPKPVSVSIEVSESEEP